MQFPFLYFVDRTTLCATSAPVTLLVAKFQCGVENIIWLTLAVSFANHPHSHSSSHHHHLKYKIYHIELESPPLTASHTPDQFYLRWLTKVRCQSKIPSGKLVVVSRGSETSPSRSMPLFYHIWSQYSRIMLDLIRSGTKTSLQHSCITCNLTIQLIHRTSRTRMN
ncbi:hypothetical protein B0O99DRAFT_642601 [Bisporella sp. PMI_857]|nr:hypothetical protein B0O99DRAFT_642601 [Bisporella sp. PMI_857]